MSYGGFRVRCRYDVGSSRANRSRSFPPSVPTSKPEIVAILSGDEDDDSDDDNIIAVYKPAKEMRAAGSKYAKKTTVKPPPAKKIRTQENLTTRQRNWNDQYNLALQQFHADGFASVVSGDRIYSWMNQAVTKVGKFDASGLSANEYDKKCGSCSWTSSNIKKARPLIHSFKSSRSSRANKRHSTTDSFHSRPRNMFNSHDHFDSADDLDPSFCCKNDANQRLYSELANAANFRLSIGRMHRNHGHFETGKQWCKLARNLRMTYVHVRSTTVAQCLFGVGNTGVLKDHFDHFFSHNQFRDESGKVMPSGH